MVCLITSVLYLACVASSAGGQADASRRLPIRVSMTWPRQYSTRMMVKRLFYCHRGMCPHRATTFVLQSHGSAKPFSQRIPNYLRDRYSCTRQCKSIFERGRLGCSASAGVCIRYPSRQLLLCIVNAVAMIFPNPGRPNCYSAPGRMLSSYTGPN